MSEKRQSEEQLNCGGKGSNRLVRNPMQHAKVVKTVLSLILASSLANIQAQSWKKLDYNDPMSGKSYSQFALEGTYLNKPVSEDKLPILIAACKDSKIVMVRMQSGLFFRVNSTGADSPNGRTLLRFRVDQKRASMQLGYELMQDGKTVEISNVQLRNIYRGHSAVIEFTDFAGEEIYAHFDVPSPDQEMQRVCGLD